MKQLITGLVIIFCLCSTQASELEYTWEPCCQLCPATRNPLTYETGSLSGMRMLVDGRDGWLFRTHNDFLESFGPDDASLKRLQQFVSTLKRSGIELMIVYIPTRGLMHPDKILEDTQTPFSVENARAAYESALIKLRASGALVPNLSEAYLKPTEKDFYFKRDHHWTPEGAKQAAKIIADYLKSQAIYKQLATKSFVTHDQGVFHRNGQLQLAARRICGTDYPAQYPTRYATEMENQEDLSEDLLFGDAAVPEVVLLGTSNSWNNRQDFNFSGFLKEYAQLDILNESLAGGNFDGALLQYFNSDTYKEAKPKLIIWEMPSYYDLIDTEFYRRIIPMVDNGCDGREVVVSSSTQLKAGRNEILFNKGSFNPRLKHRDLIFDLQFDNPLFKEFKGHIWYVHGRRELVKFNVSERVDMKGRYIFEGSILEDPEDFFYLSTDIFVPEDTDTIAMPKTVNARICLKDYD